MTARPCPLCRLLRRDRPPAAPPPPVPAPPRLTAPALAEAAALIGSAVYGVDVPAADPSVPAPDVEAALAGIAVAVLGELFADRGALYLARLGEAAGRAVSGQDGAAP